MNIIAGKFKGANLYSLTGKTTRPTTAMIREVIFSKIFDCNGLRVLDLFAGSGSIGLEALSRGAKSTHFVEGSNRAVQIIKKNIFKLQVQDSIDIFHKKVDRFLNTCSEKYDIVFLDPPYDKKLVDKTLDLIYKNDIISDKGQIIVERYFKEDINEKFSDNIISDKKYRSTTITFLKK